MDHVINIINKLPSVSVHGVKGPEVTLSNVVLKEALASGRCSYKDVDTLMMIGGAALSPFSQKLYQAQRTSSDKVSPAYKSMYFDQNGAIFENDYERLFQPNVSLKAAYNMFDTLF